MKTDKLNKLDEDSSVLSLVDRLGFIQTVMHACYMLEISFMQARLGSRRFHAHVAPKMRSNVTIINTCPTRACSKTSKPFFVMLALEARAWPEI